MRERKKKRVRVIDGADAQHFERALNDALDDMPDPDITFDRNRPFLAYVTYVEIIEIPENIQEAYEMRGEYHKCGECPYFHESTDRRVKYVDCDLGQRTHAKSNACRLFYKMLNEGTLSNPKKIIRR